MLKLHGDESLKRIRMRENKKRQILNDIGVFIMIILIIIISITMFHIVALAGIINTSVAQKPSLIYEDNESKINIDQVEIYYDRSYFKSCISSAPPNLNNNTSAMEEYIPTDIDILYEEYEKEKMAKEAFNSSVLEEYKWVQCDESGNTNSMTDDLVLYTYNLSEENGIDPALVFGMIMVESRGFSNTRNNSSGAAGLGQFMAGTGKLVYEEFLGNGKGSYDHNVTPYDPYTGITMMITYLSYLYERHGNTMTVLESYSGNRTYEGTLRYYNRVVSWVGKDIQ